MTRINTSQYVWTHGRRPRGYGHWVFVADLVQRTHGETAVASTNPFTFEGVGNYGDVARKARQAAAAAGFDLIVAAP
jgi:hypothetical protein